MACRPPRASFTSGADIDGVFVDRCAVGIFPGVLLRFVGFCVCVFDPLQGHISLTRDGANQAPTWFPDGSYRVPNGSQMGVIGGFLDSGGPALAGLHF